MLFDLVGTDRLSFKNRFTNPTKLNKMKEWKENSPYKITRIMPKVEPEKSGREKRREKRKLQRKKTLTR